MAVVSESVILLCLGCFTFIPFCVSDGWFSNSLQMVVEEGRSHSMKIETSLPELVSITAHMVTLQEYESLTNDAHFMCKTTLSDLLRAHFNETQLSSLNLDTAEDTDLSNRSYNISFNSGVTTFSLEVADDDISENEEFFVMYIDIPEPQNITSECAFLVKIRDNDDLTFAWNMPRIIVYEDEGVIRNLQIFKYGSNEQNVSLYIHVDQANDLYEATYGIDYRLLQATYIFDSEVTNLSITFEVYNDTIGEIPEHFYLNFTYQYGNSDNISVPESRVTIYILDRITFITQPANVSTEYRETVKIPCTPTSRNIPSWMIGYSNGTIESYTTSRDLPAYITLTFDGIDVLIQDFKLNLTNFTCSIHVLIPDVTTGIFSVVQLNSRTGILTITFPSVSFSLLSQHDTGVHSAHVREGETIYFRVIKEGGENYTYNVTVHSTDSSITSDLFFVFDPIMEEQDAKINIPNHLNLVDTLQFEIIIIEVNATDYGRIDVDKGEPIHVTLYDTSYTIEFFPSDITIPEGSANEYPVCADISKPSVVDPQTALSISLSLNDSKECLKLQVNEISLKSAGQTVCFEIYYMKNDTNCCGNFRLNLNPQDQWTMEGNYSVVLQPQYITITIDDDCHPKDIVVDAIIGTMAGAGAVLVVIIIVSILCCCKIRSEYSKL